MCLGSLARPWKGSVSRRKGSEGGKDTILSQGFDGISTEEIKKNRGEAKRGESRGEEGVSWLGGSILAYEGWGKINAQTFEE